MLLTMVSHWKISHLHQAFHSQCTNKSVITHVIISNNFPEWIILQCISNLLCINVTYKCPVIYLIEAAGGNVNRWLNFLGFSRWCYVAGWELGFSHPGKGKPTLPEENSLTPHPLFLFLYMMISYPFNLLSLIHLYTKAFHTGTGLCALLHFVLQTIKVWTCTQSCLCVFVLTHHFFLFAVFKIIIGPFLSLI